MSVVFRGCRNQSNSFTTESRAHSGLFTRRWQQEGQSPELPIATPVFPEADTVRSCSGRRSFRSLRAWQGAHLAWGMSIEDLSPQDFTSQTCSAATSVWHSGMPLPVGG